MTRDAERTAGIFMEMSDKGRRAERVSFIIERIVDASVGRTARNKYVFISERQRGTIDAQIVGGVRGKSSEWAQINRGVTSRRKQRAPRPFV